MQLWEVNGSTTTLADFTSHFSFQISKVTGFDGDGHGFAFVLVNENATLSPMSFGGLLGMFESSDAGTNGDPRNPVVAVEFDTFKNDWDYSTRHIGIDVNVLRSKNYTNTTDGFMDRGIANVWVVYNSTTRNLSASLTFNKDSASYDVSYVVDLSFALPQRVRVGFTGATRTYVELHQIYSWSFNSSLEENIDTPPPLPRGPATSSPLGPPTPGKNKVVALVVGITTGLFAVIFISGLALYHRFKSRRKLVVRNPLIESPLVPPPSPDIEYSGPKKFSYHELSRATHNFDNELKLGEGGFGDVYQGNLANSNEEIAVKKFKSGSSQGKKEYVSEVNVISNLRHKNLVQLKGWCHENEELILVYDFMPNKSLDFHLFGKGFPLLNWVKRYKIANDLASALHYLQDGCDPFVLHRDIKSSNIMLDSNFNAKLGDFGLARLTDQDHSFKTTVPAGTLGYLAPEVISSGKVSKASETYSCGMVALEIASGRRPIDNSEEDLRKLNLVEWIWDLYGKGSILEAVDTRLNGEFNQDQARRLMVVGLWCCHPDPGLRPSIKQVQAMLNFEVVEPNLPSTIPTPTYIYINLLSSNVSMEDDESRSSKAVSQTYTSSSTT